MSFVEKALQQETPVFCS